jgi:hypothetical protein
MKQLSVSYRVIVPTALFGTVRVSKGDVVRRELLGYNLRKLLEQGVVEPIEAAVPAKRVQATLM